MDPKESNHNSHSNDEKQKKSNRSPPYALFNLLVIIVAIIYAVYYQLYMNDGENLEEAVAGGRDESDQFKIPMFTSDELKEYNGEGECQINQRKLFVSCTFLSCISSSSGFL